MPSSVTRELTIAKTGCSEIRLAPVAASQTITLGDILIASDSNGRVTQAASAGNNVAAAGANVRLCVAAQNSASAAADTEISIETVDEDTRLRMPLCNDDAAQAWSNAYRNKQYEIRRNTTTGYYTVNVNANTNAKVEVIEPDESTQSDTAPYVWVKPILSNGSWAR